VSSSYQRLRFTSPFTTLEVFTLSRLLDKFLRSTNYLDYRISCHVASHPTTLVQWVTFDRGQVGATCRSMTHSRLIEKLRGVLNGVLKLMTKRDPRINGLRHFCYHLLICINFSQSVLSLCYFSTQTFKLFHQLRQAPIT
jgi:hypothetical protein